MNPFNPDSSAPDLAERWRPREEILQEHLDSLSPDELREVRPAYYCI